MTSRPTEYINIGSGRLCHENPYDFDASIILAITYDVFIYFFLCDFMYFLVCLFQEDMLDECSSPSSSVFAERWEGGEEDGANYTKQVHLYVSSQERTWMYFFVYSNSALVAHPFFFLHRWKKLSLYGQQHTNIMLVT